MIHHLKIAVNGYMVPLEVEERGERLWLTFGYNKKIIEEVKMMEGRKWHGFEDPPIKKWSVANSERNWFQLNYLQGKPVYAPYDIPLKEIKFNRKLYQHQDEIARHIITRKYCIIAAGMGLGKTLSAITAMEYLAANEGYNNFFYVAPKAALVSVKLEFEKWQTFVRPYFCTYETLKSVVENWPSGNKPPNMVVFDESSRCKTPTAQRSLAAQHLASAIRNEWGDKGSVVLMSGTPAPKSPLDWYMQTEIARPGFLREGSYQLLRSSLAILSEQKSIADQVFYKIESWKDDSRKCEKCGKFPDDPAHQFGDMANTQFHTYKQSVNEIERLYKRLNGLVLVKLKKDCLDLPEKIYIQIKCKPTQEILYAARLITAGATTVIQCLTLLRELSDGFQYQKQEDGVETCPSCNGQKTIYDKQYCGPDEEYEQVQDDLLNGRDVKSEYFRDTQVACTYCNATGQVIKYITKTVEVPCPKDDELENLIEQHSEIGRMVVYAGFTGSIDRVCRIFTKAGWHIIRVDGRGWQSTLQGDNQTLIKTFQEDNDLKIAFIAQSGSGGMGLTLTASPSIVYFSNDFNGESRSQSEDRIHRIGMNKERGATIYDLIHLPSDQLILDNHKAKRELQAITLGEFRQALETNDDRTV